MTRTSLSTFFTASNSFWNNQNLCSAMSRLQEFYIATFSFFACNFLLQLLSSRPIAQNVKVWFKNHALELFQYSSVLFDNRFELNINQWWKYNNFLTGTIQYLAIPSHNFSHKYTKAMKSRSTFGPPCIVHFKNIKNVRYILKTTISKSTKKRQAIGYVRQLALSPKVVQAMQLE